MKMKMSLCFTTMLYRYFNFGIIIYFLALLLGIRFFNIYIDIMIGLILGYITFNYLKKLNSARK
ncbi:MAG: hypothetical protein PF542_01910 [Nanoarchaeota archaeon]|nr:hypothetical protein [Nanoarchaeota archaeon]